MLLQVEIEVAPVLRKNRQAIALARRAAQAGRDEARRLCHVRSGRLKRSIRVQRTESGWAYGTDLSYAPYVEALYPFISAARPAALAALSSLDRRKVKAR